MATSTHFVPVTSIDDLRSKIAKLAKRAARIGCEPITMVEGATVTLHETRDMREWIVDPQMATTGKVVDAITVTVTGETPKFAGWQFLATLEPLGEENIIRTYVDAGEDTNLSEYRSRIGECDHCCKQRRRKDTYVVQHDDGSRKMVGKNCLRDFLGHSNPNQLASFAELILELEAIAGEYCDDESYERCGVASWDIDMFLAMSSAAVRSFGWTSRSAARDSFDGKVATADIVVAHLSAKTHDDNWAEMDKKLTPAKREADRASEALQWCLTHVPAEDNDYLTNLRLIAQTGRVTSRHAGYAASMLIAHAKFEERQLESQRREDRPESHHIGSVGERLTLKVTCEKIIETVSDWGCTGIHKLVDEAGNDLTWFASGSSEWIDEGATITVKATIKSHDAYNGRKQTVVNRVKEFTPKAKVKKSEAEPVSF